MNIDTRLTTADRHVPEHMRAARHKTREVIDCVARWIKPGMRKSEALGHCEAIARELGMDWIWHPAVVRFGANTLKTSEQASDTNPVLQENDIFFIDLCAVWNGQDGDAGATFAVGDDAGMKACVEAARTLFDDVKHRWQNTGETGPALLAFTERRAAELGWRLNPDAKAHLAPDFPRSIYQADHLDDDDVGPDIGLRILEIQLAHPTRPFGAFYKDLLG